MKLGQGVGSSFPLSPPARHPRLQSWLVGSTSVASPRAHVGSGCPGLAV